MTRSFPRRGLTLIELLVVVTIMVSLAVLMVPVLRPALQQRRIREAARVVNLALSTAHSQAIQTGRGHGVLFERNKNLPQACTTLRQVEVPPPYTGDTTGAVVQVTNATFVTPNAYRCAGYCVLKIKVSLSDFSNGVLREGDRIRFNFQGPTYTLWRDTSNFAVSGTQMYDFPLGTDGYYQFDPPPASPCVLTARILESDVNAVPWPDASSGQPWSLPVPFTIERQWVSSSAPPVVLPGQTAIDLCFSGEEDLNKAYAPPFGANSPNDTVPVVVLFSPSGSLKELSVNGNQIPPLGSVFFLIGQRDRVPLSNTANSPAEDGRANIADANNLWVTVAPQTGLVTTSPLDDGADPRTTAREQERMGGN
jgi:prepilin-type N-terminal cleavage/methylation domain-containing protein